MSDFFDGKVRFVALFAVLGLENLDFAGFLCG